MFGYSTVKIARSFGPLIDSHLRHELIGAIRPLKYTPCFLHSLSDAYIRKVKSFPIIIKFKTNHSCFENGVQHLCSVVDGHMRCKLGKAHPSLYAHSGSLTAEAIEDLCNNNEDIEKVYFDRPFSVLLDTATKSTNAHVLQENGFTGEGVGIAILDTGVYPSADLTEPEMRITAFKDFINERAEPYDDNGHGTHCAGDAAGNGRLSDGLYKGPAPNANVIGVKVLNKTGAGSLSTILAGIDWCIENKDAEGIHILSLSLGSAASLSQEDDLVVQAVNTAWDAGLIVVAAAGNEGPGSRTIASPGISEKILTVGALDDQNTTDRADDFVASFSSRGPTIDGQTKPDVLAPGVDIVSLRSPNSYLDKLTKSSRVNSHYTSMSGTSMSTPICAGICAQLLQQYPDLEPDSIKARIIAGAKDLGLEANAQGYGSIDAKKSAEDD